MWANASQDKIAEILNPILLDFYSKKNMRSLSSNEYTEAETARTKLFLSAQPNQTIDSDYVTGSLSSLDNKELQKTYSSYLSFIKHIKSDFNRELTVNELKDAKSYFYSLVYDNSTGE